jgi:ribosome-binding protein aMBF1 (putative translation factor)
MGETNDSDSDSDIDGDSGQGGARSAFPGFDRLAESSDELVRRLARRRLDLGLSQTEVAARMGTSQSTVARIESGGSDLRLSTLGRYAGALGTSISYHVEPSEEPER